MASPLGPLFANAFMADFEKKYMDKLEKLGVKMWRRFVDDVFAIIESKEQADIILNFLNSQHKNIKFTIEHEKDNKLPFLDPVVIRQVGKWN